MSFRILAKIATAILLASISLSALAASSDPALEFNRLSRPSDTIGALGNNLFGEQVDLYSGQTSFDITDVSIPGNSKLPVSLGRRLDVAEPDQAGPLPSFGNWEVDVPYISGYYAEAGWVATNPDGTSNKNRCSVADKYAPIPPMISKVFGRETAYFYGHDYWSGITMRVPGGGTQELLVKNSDSPLPSPSTPYHWVTKNDWVFSCVASLKSDTTGTGGEGFVATAPDGTVYTFDVLTRIPGPPSNVSYQQCVDGSCSDYATFYRDKYFLLASHVQDRFGNWVNYNYTAGKLNSITSSDGREIDINWNSNGTIHTAVAVSPSSAPDSRTWTYTYKQVAADDNDNPNTSWLSGVKQPDSASWVYDYTGSLVLHIDPPPPDPTQDGHPPYQPGCNREDPVPIGLLPPNNGVYGAFTMTATHPSGEQGLFTFTPQIRGLSHAPYCQGVPIYPWTRKQFALTSKTLTDTTLPNAPPLLWSYNYSPPNESYQGYCASPCANTVWTDVTGPDKTHVLSTFGNWFEQTEGQLQEVTTYLADANGNVQTVLDDATTSYVGADTAFPKIIGDAPQRRANVFLTEEQHPVRTHTQIRQDVTFTTKVNSFSAFANPVSTTRSSVSGIRSDSRTDVQTYYDRTDAAWVIQQPKALVNSDTGLTVYDKTFDPNSVLPTSVHSFGRLEDSYKFYPDGNLLTVTEGSTTNQTTTLSSYKRGVPQSLQFADGTTKAATVDDFGDITSITDMIGATLSDPSTSTTAFDYDAMGRVKTITPPAGDTVSWLKTSIAFQKIGTAELGLQIGHWKQTETTGKDTKVTYFDGTWQPVITTEYDPTSSTTIAATSRTTVKDFDFDGRTTYASYPVGALAANFTYTRGMIPTSRPFAGSYTTYDGLGRTLTNSQDSELSQGLLTTTYNYLTNFQTRVTNPRGYSTTTGYQVFDAPDTSAPVSIFSPMGVTTAIARDVFGKPSSITRSGTWAGAPISQTRNYVYDTHQRLCKRVEAETGATLMDYDSANNIAWTLPGSTLTAIGTSAQCEIERTQVADGAKLKHTYDLRDRPLGETVPGSTPIAWTYYNDGALNTLTSGTGATANVWTYTYNKRRLPVTEQLVIDGRSKTVTHGYDTLGHESTLRWPSGLVVASTPNPLGQPTQAGTYATAVSYFPNGGMSGFTYGNQVLHTLTQNTRQLPQESLDAKGGTTILDDSYSFDENANVTGIGDGAGTPTSNNNRTMSYDALDRLTGTSAPAQPWVSASQTYDPLDNLRSNWLGGRHYDFNYDGNFRLGSVINHGNGLTKMTLGYDANGNVTSKGNGNDSYLFDRANRMQSVVGKESYIYDGYGRRVKTTTLSGPGSGKIDYPVYSMSGQLLTDDDQRVNATTDFINLNGSLVAKRTATIGSSTYTTTYEHTDALHSPVAVSDASGALVGRSLNTPFGEPSNGTYVQGPGFTGHVTDAFTGLTYAQQRYYDPVLGRFITSDPVDAGNSGVNFNRYKYAANNPFGYTDPDGRCESVATCQMMHDDMDLASGRMSRQEFDDRNQARAAGAAIGFLVVAAYFAPGVVADVVGTARTGQALRALDRAASQPASQARMVTVGGVKMEATPAGARAALEKAGYPGRPSTLTSESGTIHDIPGLKMEVRVMDGGKGGPPRIVTSRLGNPAQRVNPVDGKNLGNIPKSDQQNVAHIPLDQNPGTNNGSSLSISN